MSDSLPPSGRLSEWPTGQIAGVFFLAGVLVGALLFWVVTLIMSEQEPNEDVNTAASTTTSLATTTSSSPDPTVPDAPATSGETDASTPVEDTSARAPDREAQSNLRNAFTAARTIATDYEGRFEKNAAGDPIDGAALEAENPDSGLTYGPPGSAAVDRVSVGVSSMDGPNSHIWLITQSSAGTFYCIGGTSAGEVSYSKGESEAAAKTTCSGGAQGW